MKRKRILIVIITVAAVICWGAYELAEPIMVMHGLSKLAQEKKNRLLYETDHEKLAFELRKFASEVRWNRSDHNPEPQVFRPELDPLPMAIRALKPTAVIVSDDRIKLDEGTLEQIFGIAVFPNGIVGEGLKELGPGVWFYSSDNKIPAKQ